MQVSTETDFQHNGQPLFYIKLIGVAKSAIEKNNGQLPDLSKIMGFFVWGDPDQMRSQLHNFVDQACDAWEKANNA